MHGDAAAAAAGDLNVTSLRKIAGFDPATPELLASNNMTHERVIPDGASTTRGGQTQVVLRRQTLVPESLFFPEP